MITYTMLSWSHWVFIYSFIFYATYIYPRRLWSKNVHTCLLSISSVDWSIIKLQEVQSRKHYWQKVHGFDQSNYWTQKTLLHVSHFEISTVSVSTSRGCTSRDVNQICLPHQWWILWRWKLGPAETHCSKTKWKSQKCSSLCRPPRHSCTYKTAQAWERLLLTVYRYITYNHRKRP